MLGVFFTADNDLYASMIHCVKYPLSIPRFCQEYQKANGDIEIHQICFDGAANS